MTNNTRRQHYVWQKYLRAWTDEGKIQCLRKGAAIPFPTSPKNVAVERDFYRLTPLTAEDVAWIERIVIQPLKNDFLREMNSNWLANFKLAFSADDFIRRSGRASPEIISKLDLFLNTQEEHAYAVIENFARAYLEALTSGDTNFFYQDRKATEFCYFICHQYLRTKKVRDRLMQQFSATPVAESFDRMWPVLRHIFATNMGWSLFSSRNDQPLKILESPSGMEFITSDQPVINTHTAFKKSFDPPKETEIYYPVSPRYAVIFSDDPSLPTKKGEPLSEFRTTYFNQLVEASAHEQLFSRSSGALANLNVGGPAY